MTGVPIASQAEYAGSIPVIRSNEFPAQRLFSVVARCRLMLPERGKKRGSGSVCGSDSWERFVGWRDGWIVRDDVCVKRSDPRQHIRGEQENLHAFAGNVAPIRPDRQVQRTTT